VALVRGEGLRDIVYQSQPAPNMTSLGDADAYVDLFAPPNGAPPVEELRYSPLSAAAAHGI